MVEKYSDELHFTEAERALLPPVVPDRMEVGERAWDLADFLDEVADRREERAHMAAASRLREGDVAIDPTATQMRVLARSIRHHIDRPL